MFRYRLPLMSVAVLFLTLAGAARAETSAASAPIRQNLPDGATILCRQETDTPLVAVQVFVKAGAAQQTAETAGLGSLLARTLLSSTSDQTPEALAEQIGAIGGSVNVTWQPDWTQISALTVSDRFDAAISLITDVLANADFDPQGDSVEAARQQMLAEIDANESDLFQTAYSGVRGELYGGSGYALPPTGTPASLKHLGRADLLRYFNRHFVPSNFVFVVVGNIDPQAAVRKIEQNLTLFPTQGRGGRRPESAPEPPPAPASDLKPIHAYQVDLAETCVMVGYRVPGIASSDYPAMLVANALLGGMKTSRLFTNLREKQGLAYELGSAYNAQWVAGDLIGFVFAPPTRSDPATKKSVSTLGLVKDQILAQFESLKAAPPTPAELARAQHFVIGTYKIKHERIEDRANWLGITEIARRTEGYQFDTDYTAYIDKVTAADVQRVAAKYFVHPAISIVEPDAKNGSIINE